MVPEFVRSAARKNWLRLDALLVKRGLVESRTQAQALVLSAAVRVGGEVVTKAGSYVAPDAEISVEPPRERTFVSRAGEKLEHALDAFSVEVQGRAQGLGEGDAAIIRITPTRIISRGLDGTPRTHSRAIDLSTLSGTEDQQVSTQELHT